ncbi:MAG TPA: hypothetical protein VD846_00380 [Allosphingosinicella sp.]|nr:hypothetical protein [Allosphingosinicella sp.]
MATTIFDWIVRTAMLVMAGLVTLSILGAIATMSNDPGTGFAGGDRPLIDARPAQEREGEAAPAPARPGEQDSVAPAPAPGQAGTVVAVPPPKEDRQGKWLEAIAYALLALVGIAAIGVLMLWRAVRELGRLADRRDLSR